MNQEAHPWLAAQWNSIHGGPHNADAFSYPSYPNYRQAWRALKGCAVLFGPAIDRSGQLFVCSGRGAGHSHVHALTPEGALRWESGSSGDAPQPGARVCPFAPLLDGEGGLYVADEHAFWCFEADGSLRWRTELPPLGVRQGFASAIFSPLGHVGGVAMDGCVLLLDRHSGEPVMRPYWLPAGMPPAPPPVPPGLWAGNMMDADLVQMLYAAFFGFGHQVTNTPAVGIRSSMIYIPAAGPDRDSSYLYGLREWQGRLETVFAAPFSGRCAVTPSLSPDEEVVYTGNARGELFAFCAASGELLWQHHPAGPAASPTVALDGTVYTGTNTLRDQPSRLFAIDPACGRVRWSRDYDSIAADMLTPREVLPPFFNDPSPRAVINSVQTLGAEHLLVVLVLGYTFTAKGQAPMTQPHRVVLASIDPDSGEVMGNSELPDTSESAVVLAGDGSVYVCHASLSSSLFYYGINPLLPESHRTALAPSGGVTALRPHQVLS